jgi:hypothetical protein
MWRAGPNISQNIAFKGHFEPPQPASEADRAALAENLISPRFF